MSIVRDLRNYAEQAREQRLSGPHTNGGEFPLVGMCFDNALVLYNILSETKYDPTFIVGTTDKVGDDLSQAGIDLESNIDSVDDLAGHVHYWVRCSGYVVDIASDTFDRLGEIRVEKDPDDYYTYPDSESTGETTLSSGWGRRCWYCGAQITQCDHEK